MLAYSLFSACHEPLCAPPGPSPIIAEQQGPIMNLVPPSSYGMETNGLPAVGNVQGPPSGGANAGVGFPGHGGVYDHVLLVFVSCCFGLRRHFRVGAQTGNT